MPVEQGAIDYLLRRVRAEYHEMPGLRLTLTQAARLWSLDRSTCAALLDVLVSREFLAQTVDGSYVPADGGPSRTAGALEWARRWASREQLNHKGPYAGPRHRFRSAKQEDDCLLATKPGVDRASG